MVPRSTNGLQIMKKQEYARDIQIVIENHMRSQKYLPAMKLLDAKALVLGGQVAPQPDGTYLVQGSATQPYVWHPETGCTCAQATKAHTFCKHATAVDLYRKVAEYQGQPHPGVEVPQAVEEALGESVSLETAPTSIMKRCIMCQGTPITDYDVVDWGCGHRVCEWCMKDGCPVEDCTFADLVTEEVPHPSSSAIPGPSVEAVPQARRSITAIIADLSQPLPKGCIAIKEARNTKTGTVSKFAYIHWQTAVRLLDTYAPGWHGQIRQCAHLAGHILVVYRLTIPCLEGEVWREATGCEVEDLVIYGDQFSNAEAMAFKRAAAKFGVALDLYDKDETAQALAQHLGQEGDPRPLGPLPPATARKRIVALLSSQGHAPKSKADYERLVLGLTGLPLVADHFGEIIRRLEYAAKLACVSGTIETN